MVHHAEVMVSEKGWCTVVYHVEVMVSENGWCTVVHHVEVMVSEKGSLKLKRALLEEVGLSPGNISANTHDFVRPEQGYAAF